MPIPIKKFDCLYSNFGLLPLGVNILFNPSSKQDTVEIWDILRDHDCYLTEKEIESKITKLQDEGVIKQYTITVDTKKLRHRIIRIALVRLRVSQHLGGRFEGLKIFVRCSLCNVFRSHSGWL
ncbi:MAG TPA: hypothetical protein VFS97_07070 [Nitrososphaeraceae archaeon]|nr:hypothetical protein [Nitrososphaeraceae archaeon]